MLMSFWAATSVYVALNRTDTSEDQREWWARSGGWWIRASLCWAAGFVLVIHVPQWVLGLQAFNAAGAGALLTGGGLWGAVIGFIGYWSRNGQAVTGGVRRIANAIGSRVLDLAAIAFILALLVAICIAIFRVLASLDAAPGYEPDYAQQILRSGWHATALFVALFFLGHVFAVIVGVNTFSLHSMYGNRLVRAYFGAARAGQERNPDAFTGFDNADNVSMTELRARDAQGVPRLFPVINLALNLGAPSGERLEWQQRKAASFSVTPLHSGSADLGYAPSADYAGPKDRGISLARAMTISGAAASSNMGYHSSAPVAMVMTLFNVRLGWWLPNTACAGRRIRNRGEPRQGALRLLLMEALGQTTNDKPWVYLSDGGHFENLGLYEMVRRRCRRILVIDCGADPQYTHGDLEDAIRKIRVDFGISVEFPKGSFDAPRRHTVGTIRYADADPGGKDGLICVIKPALFGGEPLDVRNYAAASRKRDGANAFPQQSTADQFFDEAQFESYRMLGYFMLTRAFAIPGDWPSQSGAAA